MSPSGFPLRISLGNCHGKSLSNYQYPLALRYTGIDMATAQTYTPDLLPVSEVPEELADQVLYRPAGIACNRCSFTTKKKGFFGRQALRAHGKKHKNDARAWQRPLARQGVIAGSIVALVALGLIGSADLPTTGEENNLSGISGGGALADGKMALGGHFTICLLFANCIGPLPIPITVNGTVGAGLGGTFTVNTFADSGFKLSVGAAPWTIGVASIKSASTDMSPPGCQVGAVGCATNATYTYDDTRSGFAHSPASGTNVDVLSGKLQVVTPVKILTNLNPPSTVLAVWGILTLHTIPEPGLAILLGSGVAGLVLLGRQRMRK